MHTSLEFSEFIIECLLFNPHLYLIIFYKLKKKKEVMNQYYNNWLWLCHTADVHRGSSHAVTRTRFGTYNSPGRLMYIQYKTFGTSFYSWTQFPFQLLGHYSFHKVWSSLPWVMSLKSTHTVNNPATDILNISPTHCLFTSCTNLSWRQQRR